MIFGALNPEKIWHQELVLLPTSPYTAATLPWEMQKSHFSRVLFMYIWLFRLSQKKTNCYTFTHYTWKISPHYLVKCKTFSSNWRWCCVPPHCAEIQPMSQQDASKTRPYRGLVLDRPTHALVSLTVSKLGCTKLIFIEPGAKINRQYYRDVLLTQKLLYQQSAALLETCLSSSKTVRQHIVLVT